VAPRPRIEALAPLPPRRLGAVRRREQPPLPRSRALGAGRGLRALPPRRRRRRRGRLAPSVQAALRRGRVDRVRGRQGDSRRNPLPGARRQGVRRLFPGLSRYREGVIVKALFWASLGGLAWTHVGYPVAAAGLRQLRRREIDRQDITPTVTLIVPAHDEEDASGARVENLLELDYPAEKLQLVVAADGSTDRTHEIVQSFDGRVRLLECDRRGKLPTMNAAIRETDSEILAFGDANATWAPDALRKLVRSFADPDVAYVCGQV